MAKLNSRQGRRTKKYTYELERREIAFMKRSIKATSREELNKRLSEKWNEKKLIKYSSVDGTKKTN